MIPEHTEHGGEEIPILPDERVEPLNERGLCIIQKEHGFRFGVEAVLLADFADIGPRMHVVDFGAGTGILPLLLWERGKGESFDAFELQPGMAEMAERSMRLNGLSGCIRVHAAAVEHADACLPQNSIDAIVCNPPYRCGSMPADLDRRLAMMLPEDGLRGWYRKAAWLLKGHGRFFCVQQAENLAVMLDGLRGAGLEPKRLKLVYAGKTGGARFALAEAVKSAKPGLKAEQPVFLNSKGDVVCGTH